MIRLLSLAASLACCTVLSAADAPKAPRALFAMDNGLTTVASIEEKAALLKELGYAGIGWRPGHTAEMLKALDAQSLKMFSFYVSVGSEPQSKLAADLPAELELLKGRETIVWVVIGKGKSSEEASAVRSVREVADLAAANNLRVALYPHAGCYVESAKDALRLLKAVDRPNLGLSFNLCHFLKLDSEDRLEEALREVAPKLLLVQTNGADSGDTRKMGWERLIQPLGGGTYDNSKLLAALDRIGYAGPVGLQCYQLKAPAREHLSKSIAAWRKLNSVRVENGSASSAILEPKAPSAVPPGTTDDLKSLLQQAAACDHGHSRLPLTALLERAQAAKPEEWPAIEAALAELLENPKATGVSKLAVCALLARRGGTASVGALAALLGSRASSPALETEAALQCSHAAARALELIAGPQAETALLESLPKLPARLRENVVAALGRRRCAAVVEPLGALLTTAADQPPLFAAVCTALARIGDRRAAELLREKLAGAPPSQQAILADASLQCAQHRAAEGAKEEARGLYEALLTAKAVPLARAGAVKGLAILVPESAPELLATALTDNERHVRYAALAALKVVPGEQLTARASGLLSRIPADQAVQLIEVLMLRGDRSARAAIVQAASSKEESICVAALSALAFFGKTDDVPLLLERLGDEGTIAQAAGFALTRLPDRGVAARVRELSAGLDAKRQAQTVRLLADRADPSDSGVLCELLSSATAAVAVEAARGLKLAGGEPEFRCLVELLGTGLDQAQVRQGVEEAIARIVKRVWRGDSAQVLALLKGASDRQRASLLTVLGLIGDDRALPEVIAAGKAADGSAKEAAVRALADWPTATPLMELLEFARTTTNEKQHVLAMRGYIRMLDLLKEKPPANLKALYEAGQQAARRDEERRALDPAKAAAKPAPRGPVGYE